MDYLVKDEYGNEFIVRKVTSIYYEDEGGHYWNEDELIFLD